MARTTGRRRGRMVVAAVPLAVAVGAVAAPAAAAPYPPPDQPTTSTSASEVKAGDPLTVCAEHYGDDVDVNLTDDGHDVTTLHTDQTGRGCATVAWKNPHATAKPVHGSAAARTTPGGGASRIAPGSATWVVLRAPEGTVCHTLTTTGPDASGATATTHAQVCVEPADNGSVSGSSSGGGRTAENSGLPFTGAEIAGMLAVALAAIGLGTAGVAAGRRRRA